MSIMADVVVVTGASAGFGKDIARKLAAAGYRVFGTVRDPSGRNAAAARELEAAGVTAVDIDVTDQQSVDRGAARILADAGHVDVLINNAGTAFFGAAETFTPAAFERQFATNVIGPHRLNRAFLPGMRERGKGLLVFVSSGVGRFVMPFAGVYSASKHALEAMAEALSYELRPFGVDSAIVEPGPYATNIFGAIITGDDTARAAAYGELGKMGEKIAADLAGIARDPGEVGDAIVALVQMPAGQRPLRTVVPTGGPVESINSATQPIQRTILEKRGFGEFLPEQVAAN
jgi:NAD(P)-dependent dehydrogenase (short-subunit alcohol dehydrogenase family)